MKDFVGDLAYKGPLNHYLNLAIADRADLTQNLLFKEDPKLVDDVGYFRATMFQSLGPTASFLGGVEDGVKLANEGHYERAIEHVLPSSIGNVLKSFRFMSDEGALTKDGKPIVKDISTYNAVMQAIGFAPADLSQTYVERGQAMDIQKGADQRKQHLLDLMYAARQSGDDDTFDSAREKLLTLGRKYPGLVTANTIMESFRMKAKNMQTSVSGLNIQKPFMNQVRERFESLHRANE
jgi:hypothetical protein